MAFAFDISADPRPTLTSSSPRLNATLADVVPVAPLRILRVADIFADEIDMRLTRVIEGRKPVQPVQKAVIRRDPRDLSDLAAA